MAQMKAALVGIDAVIDETYAYGDSYALADFMSAFNFKKSSSLNIHDVLGWSPVLKLNVHMYKHNMI